VGYYVEGEQAQIDIQFLPHLEATSGSSRAAAISRSDLRQGRDGRVAAQAAWSATCKIAGFHGRARRFYSHLLPSLDTKIVEWQTASPARLMAVGDAGRAWWTRSRAKACTYAIRSGDLAATSLLAEVGGLAEKIAHYRKLLRRDFAADLEFGSRLAKRIFHGASLFG